MENMEFKAEYGAADRVGEAVGGVGGVLVVALLWLPRCLDSI